MQTKLIQLKLKPSKIMISILTGLLIMWCIFIASYPQFNQLLWSIIVTSNIYWLIKHGYFSHYQIDTLSDENKIILWQHNHPQVAKLIGTFQFSFLLTLVKLRVASKTLIIPILIDSVKLNHYKAFRMYLQWN